MSKSNPKPQVGYCITHEVPCWTDDEELRPECVIVATKPPEDRPINWTDQDVPDAEELAVMDANALSLLADFQEMENVVG